MIRKSKSSAKKVSTPADKTDKARPEATPRPKSGALESRSGGETHQEPASVGAYLSTNQGVPIYDNQNSLKAGRRAVDRSGPGFRMFELLLEASLALRFDRDVEGARAALARPFGIPSPDPG